MRVSRLCRPYIDEISGLVAIMDDRTVWFKWFLRKSVARGGTEIIKSGGDW
jgi:hypothetical protein